KGYSKVKKVLERTLGVPIFQEQVMKLVEVVADFTPGEADQLRRAMAAWKRRGGLEPFRDKIRNGMLNNGYEESYFERIFEQIKGFGEYGFPESHSAGFALIAYVSSWLKRHHPAAFACALINSQPMGFYQPAQIVQDLQRHNVGVRAIDVMLSDWDCTLETEDDGQPALRLGLRLINGLAESAAKRIVAARSQRSFRDVADLVHRAALNAGERACLADADTLRTLSGHRHRARWDSAGAEAAAPVFADAPLHEQRVTLRAPSLREDVMSDYATQGLSLARHPIALIRKELHRRRIVSASDLTRGGNDGRRVRCAGLVTVRQHPHTANGTTFVTLEDETGQVNVVVWRSLAEQQYRELAEAVVMGVAGTLQSSEGVRHLIAERLSDLSHLVPELAFHSRDFH
ncbi:MAG: OB-fold nucleic acid binding domain-containing protein, partial [Dokdonella sp.]